MSKIAKIVLDSNFLMIPGQIGLDIFEEIAKAVNSKYELCISAGTIKELQKIMETAKQADRTAAKIGLDLIKKKKIKIIEAEDDYVDDELVKLSENENYLIATQDTGLKKRLKRYIYLRQKKFIEIRGNID